MNVARADPAPVRGETWRIVALCLCVAIVEGIDIQSVGVAASGIARQFDLGSTMLGLVMSTSILGMMVGAATGGWVSDLLGRKLVLLASMLILGSCTLATIVVPDVRYLVAARFLAGIGLGAALPALIALISETVSARHSGIGMGAMYCGLPVGAAVAALTMAARSSADWAAVFHLGGWLPLLLVPVLAVALPGRRPSSETTSEAASATKDSAAADRILGSRTASTLLLWVSFFFTLLAVYTLLNWLPALLSAAGVERTQALRLSIVMNLGAAAGALAIGWAVDAWRLGRVVSTTYLGMIVSLAAFVAAGGAALYPAALAVGFFVLGGQMILFSMAPRLYPASLRGRGVGAAVSVGRAGSIAGPALAGALLGVGISPNTIPVLLAAGLIVAMIAAGILVRTALVEGERSDPTI